MSILAPTFSTRPFDRLSQLMEETFLPFLPSRDLTPWSPVVDIKEEDHKYIFQMELSGVPKENISVEMAGDALTISGKREEITEDRGETFLRRERRSGVFKRTFKLDAAVRTNQVAAEFKDGLLTVTVPKIEAVKPQRITIKH